METNKNRSQVVAPDGKTVVAASRPWPLEREYTIWWDEVLRKAAKRAGKGKGKGAKAEPKESLPKALPPPEESLQESEKEPIAALVAAAPASLVEASDSACGGESSPGAGGESSLSACISAASRLNSAGTRFTAQSAFRGASSASLLSAESEDLGLMTPTASLGSAAGGALLLPKTVSTMTLAETAVHARNVREIAENEAEKNEENHLKPSTIPEEPEEVTVSLQDAPPQEPQGYEAGLVEVGSIETVQEFWRYWNNVEMRGFGIMSVFRAGVKPMWEDPGNKLGGRWILSTLDPKKKYDLEGGDFLLFRRRL